MSVPKIKSLGKGKRVRNQELLMLLLLLQDGKPAEAALTMSVLPTG